MGLTQRVILIVVGSDPFITFAVGTRNFYGSCLGPPFGLLKAASYGVYTQLSIERGIFHVRLFAGLVTPSHKHSAAFFKTLRLGPRHP